MHKKEENYIGKKVTTSLPGVEPLVPIGGERPTLQAVLNLIPNFRLKPGLAGAGPYPPANIIALQIIEVSSEGLLAFIFLVVGQVRVVVKLSQHLLQLHIYHVPIVGPDLPNGDVAQAVKGPTKLGETLLIARPSNELNFTRQGNIFVCLTHLFYHQQRAASTAYGYYPFVFYVCMSVCSLVCFSSLFMLFVFVIQL